MPLLTRRHFLTTTPLAVAAAALAPVASPASPLRIGLIGCGRRGSEHAEEIAGARTKLRLVAAADPDAAAVSRVADSAGAQGFARWEDLFGCPDVDAVVAATPDYLQPSLAAAALEHGKPLLVEAPFAGLSDLLEPHAPMEEAGLLHVACRSPFQAHWAHAARLMADGAIGRCLRIQSRLTRAALGFRVPVTASVASDSWRWNREYSRGPAVELLHHQLLPILRHGLLGAAPACLGAIAKSSRAGGAFAPVAGNPDALLVELQTTRGCRIVLAADPLSHPSYVFIRGVTGTLEFRGDVVLLARSGRHVRRFSAPAAPTPLTTFLTSLA
jgi:predicted dehydrogenase